MKVNNLYTSVGANQTPLALDWGRNGLICYGAANCVAISQPSSINGNYEVVKTLAGHTGRINAVKWISRNGEPETELISGSNDCQCILWNIQNVENPRVFDFKGHKSGITSVDAIYNDSALTIATSSADFTVRLWRLSDDEMKAEKTVESFQVLNFGNGICFCVQLCLLPDFQILLACANDDKIQLYGEASSKTFELVQTLTGHEDWIRCLDFTYDINHDILLASSSQDSFIRLWRIAKKCKENTEKLPGLIQVEEKTFQVALSTFVVSLESVLQGHENWVYSVNWSKNNSKGQLELLSSSMDKTMIIWSIDKEQGLWTEKIRVGDVGGNSLGFYGAKFHASGKSIVGHGFSGSLHLWKENEFNSKLWTPSVINAGHYKEVRDVGWEPKGDFLFSVSTDQTTRIHAACNEISGSSEMFSEIARPQVHGYDMQCLAVLSRYKFASAAEEKIVRTFQATGNFVENLRSLVKSCEKDDLEGEKILKSHQKGASVPSLGLSNKAVYEEDLINSKTEGKKFKDEYPENYFVPLKMTEPPTEEYLAQNTLWPELQKLYAHGYELYSLAATKDGKILASACKATTLEHSEIILWNTETWKILQRLRSHKLTVTQMKFSCEGNRLLSVSRDRRWTVFKNKEQSTDSVDFQLEASSDRQNGIHERIIWCCAWSHDDKFFATGSRDGKVAIWSSGEKVDQESSLKNYKHVKTIELPQESVTALAFATKEYRRDEYILAVGLESGIIHVYSISGTIFSLLKTLSHSEAHHLSVKKLEFRPNSEKFHLASCGDDHLVRIYELDSS